MKNSYLDKLNKMCIGNKILIGLLMLFIIYCLFWRTTTIVKIVPFERMENFEQGKITVPPEFEQYNNQKIFVAFLAKWCGHCNKAKPQLLEAQKENKTGIPIVMVDADKYPELVKSYGVSGYPSFQLLPSGFGSKSTSEYNGPRNKENFLKFLKQNSA